MRIFIVSLVIVLLSMAASPASAEISKAIKKANNKVSYHPNTFTPDFTAIDQSRAHFVRARRSHRFVAAPMRVQTSTPMVKPVPKKSF